MSCKFSKFGDFLEKTENLVKTEENSWITQLLQVLGMSIWGSFERKFKKLCENDKIIVIFGQD